ncbi:MAG TPA: DUF2306 domain-containing protein, partial [Ktedonobacteraceae bacterium]|nr:DUF2306 domain-containing protein [Ktedonobacteraceae bacterium]
TAGLSGLWMTQFFLFSLQSQSNLLYGFRMLFGSAMVLSIFLGLIAILRRDIARHRAWMIRGYAIGQGAGTQALTALLWVLIFGTLDQHNKDLLMGASWIINLVLAEWIIRRKGSKGRRKQVDKGRDLSKRFDLGSQMARAQEWISATNEPLSYQSKRSTGDARTERNITGEKAS